MYVCAWKMWYHLNDGVSWQAKTNEDISSNNIIFFLALYLRAYYNWFWKKYIVMQSHITFDGNLLLVYIYVSHFTLFTYFLFDNIFFVLAFLIAPKLVDNYLQSLKKYIQLLSIKKNMYRRYKKKISICQMPLSSIQDILYSER